MSRIHGILISLAICVLAAVLEGICAGKQVKGYFAKLKLPTYSAPLWVWYIIGVVYYAIFFVVLFRTFIVHADSTLQNITIGLALMMMGLNASWNYVFFRAQNLFISFFVASLFPILDLTLLVCLIQLDRIAAWTLAPYLSIPLHGRSRLNTAREFGPAQRS